MAQQFQNENVISQNNHENIIRILFIIVVINILTTLYFYIYTNITYAVWSNNEYKTVEYDWPQCILDLMLKLYHIAPISSYFVLQVRLKKWNAICKTNHRLNNDKNEYWIYIWISHDILKLLLSHAENFRGKTLRIFSLDFLCCNFNILHWRSLSIWCLRFNYNFILFCKSCKV